MGKRVPESAIFKWKNERRVFDLPAAHTSGDTGTVSKASIHAATTGRCDSRGGSDVNMSLITGMNKGVPTTWEEIVRVPS